MQNDQALDYFFEELLKCAETSLFRCKEFGSLFSAL